MSEGREFHCFGAQHGGCGVSMCLQKSKLSGRCVHSEKVREVGRGRVREKVVTYSCTLIAIATIAIYSGLDRQPVKRMKKRLHMVMST